LISRFGPPWGCATWRLPHTRRTQARFSQSVLPQEARATALCDDYANALVSTLEHAGLPGRSSIRFACLTAMPDDCHAIVEFKPVPDAPWILLDPTFGLGV